MEWSVILVIIFIVIALSVIGNVYKGIQGIGSILLLPFKLVKFIFKLIIGIIGFIFRR